MSDSDEEVGESDLFAEDNVKKWVSNNMIHNENLKKSNYIGVRRAQKGSIDDVIIFGVPDGKVTPIRREGLEKHKLGNFDWYVAAFEIDVPLMEWEYCSYYTACYDDCYYLFSKEMNVKTLWDDGDSKTFTGRLCISYTYHCYTGPSYMIEFFTNEDFEREIETLRKSQYRNREEKSVVFKW